MTERMISPSPTAGSEIQRALDSAQPGDLILLRGGLYPIEQGLHMSHVSGRPGKPIMIGSYPGETAILDGAGMQATGYYAGWVFDLNNVSQIHIKRLELRNGPEGGIMLRGASHDNRIEQLNVHHNGRHSTSEGKGVSLIGAGARNLLLNNDSHENADLRLDNADGFQISTTGAGNVLRGNRAWANSDDGFDFFNVQNGTESAPLLIACNWSFNNGYKIDMKAAGDGSGFKLGGARKGSGSHSGGHELHGNLAFGNRMIGFDDNGADRPLLLENNISLKNGRYSYVVENAASVLSGNLALDGALLVNGSGHNNSWNGSIITAQKTLRSLNVGDALGPRQSDGSLPTLRFLEPKTDPAFRSLGASQEAGQCETPPLIKHGAIAEPTTLALILMAAMGGRWMARHFH